MSGLFDAYLNGDARAIFDSHFADPGAFPGRPPRAARPVAPAVAAALGGQNARYVASKPRDAHLDALRRGAAAVVTGQQVGLFLGPLYTIYKAATAVRVARALAEESARAVVPVFWLQTEDHDLAEIATYRVARPRGASLDLSLPASPDGRISIAHLRLPEEVQTCLDALRGALAQEPFGDEHVTRLARHYRPGAGWAEAFAGVIAELFAEDGLVIVDPRDPALGEAAAPVHRHALSKAGAIAARLTARGEELEAAGFAATVRVRPGAPLSFFHSDGPAGPRYRLEPAEGGFSEVGGSRTHSLETLLAATEADPVTFSTSALLRPILQDHFLPTAAYVGGPGEIAYFAQLAPLYADYDLPMPLVVPRARFRVVDDPARRLLSRLGLEPDAAGLPEDVLLARGRDPESGEIEAAGLEAALAGPFEAALDEVAPRIETIGPGIDTAVAKTRATVRMAVSKLRAKYEKALLHRDPQRVGDVKQLKRLLHPDGVPQERVYGLSSYAGSFGDRAFVSMVLAAIAPFDAAPRDLP